jgi:hypothetical protein
MSRSIITIAILCAGITLFLGGLFLVRADTLTEPSAAEAQADTETASPALSETATYVDDWFGFSFAYPSNLTLDVFYDPGAGHVVTGDLPTGGLALIVNVTPIDEPEVVNDFEAPIWRIY